MTQHDHALVVPGCFRCELGEDEVVSVADPAHEVYVLCNCDDIEQCRMEVYVSDVRIAYAVAEDRKLIMVYPRDVLQVSAHT